MSSHSPLTDFLWESDVFFLWRTDPHGGLALRFHNLSQFSAPHTAHTVIARCDATPELLRRVDLTLMTIFFYRIIASESVLRLLGEISPQFHYSATLWQLQSIRLQELFWVNSFSHFYFIWSLNLVYSYSNVVSRQALIAIITRECIIYLAAAFPLWLSFNRSYVLTLTRIDCKGGRGLHRGVLSVCRLPTALMR